RPRRDAAPCDRCPSQRNSYARSPLTVPGPTRNPCCRNLQRQSLSAERRRGSACARPRPRKTAKLHSPPAIKRNQKSQSSNARPSDRKTRTEPTSSTNSAFLRPFPDGLTHGWKVSPASRRETASRERSTAKKHSNVEQFDRLRRALLNEGEPGLGLRSHQTLERFRRSGSVLGHHGDAQERAFRRIHGGVPQVSHRHFAKSLEPADIDGAAAAEAGLQQLLLMRVIAGVKRLVALGQPIEGRHGEVEMAF